MSAPTAEATRSCAECGYDLRAHSDTDTCPECGTPWLSGPIEFTATELPGFYPPGETRFGVSFPLIAVLVSVIQVFHSVPFLLQLVFSAATGFCVSALFGILRQGRPSNIVTLRFTSEGITALSPHSPPRFQPWLPDIAAKCTPTRLKLPGTITIDDAFDLGRPFLKFSAQLTPGLAAGLERQIKRWSSPTLPPSPIVWESPKEQARRTAEETRNTLLPYLRCPHCFHHADSCSSPDHDRPDNAIYVIPAQHRSYNMIEGFFPVPILLAAFIFRSAPMTVALFLITLLFPLLVRIPRRFPLHARFSDHGWQISYPSAPLKLRPYKGSRFDVSGAAVGITTLSRSRWIANFQWYEKSTHLLLPAQASWALLNLPTPTKRPP